MKLHNFVLLMYTLIFLAGWTTIFFFLPNRDATKLQSSTLVIMRCNVTNEFTGDVKLKYTLRPVTKGCNQ